MTERLPKPDKDLFPALIPEHLKFLGTNVSLGRIYSESGAHPSHWDSFRRFGPTSSRFDHQPRGRAPRPARSEHPKRGVTYVAPALYDARRRRRMSALKTALVECFGSSGVIDRYRDDPHFALFRVTAPLRLLDLADSAWVTEAGGNAAISSGLRSTARDWARAIYSHYPDIDGVIYTTSGLPVARSVALWERAQDRMPATPRLRLSLADKGLQNTLDTYASELRLDLN